MISILISLKKCPSPATQQRQEGQCLEEATDTKLRLWACDSWGTPSPSQFTLPSPALSSFILFSSKKGGLHFPPADGG